MMQSVSENGEAVQAWIRCFVQDQLMGQPNAIWQSIAENALPNNLKDTETMKHVLNILHKNVSVCTSLGTAFIPQMGKIFTSLLKLYR